MRLPAFLLAFLIVFVGVASASPVQVLVNSQDWRDVYAGMLYGQWQGLQYNVVTDAGQGAVLLDRMGTDQPVLLIESDSSPFVTRYSDLLKSRGFSVSETVHSSPGHPAGLELARRLNATRFIVLDGSYGYNAVSVIPYALRQKSWVVFSEDLALSDLSALLQNQNGSSVMQYGAVKKSVKDALAPFHPDIVDLGDRFSNNVALLQRMDTAQRPTQVIFSDGQFIERTMFSSFAQDGIVLVGQSVVPAVTLDYLKASPIPVGVIIGPDLSDVGRWIKANTPVKSIFAKFAQTFLKGPGVAEPWVLDQTFLPLVPLNVTIGEIRYNALSKQLEVTYQNRVSTPTYLQADLEAFLGRASILASRKLPVIVLEPNASKTVAYDFALNDSDFQGPLGNVSVMVMARYGSESGALELQVQKRQDDLLTVSFNDPCTVSLGAVDYDSVRQGFDAELKNGASVSCFLNPYLRYSLADSSPTLSLQSLSLDAGSSLSLFFYAPLKKEDFAQLPGSVLHVHVDYGGRADYLIKTLDEDRLYSLKSASITPASFDWTWMAGIAVVLAILFFIFRQRGSGPGRSYSARRRWN